MEEDKNKNTSDFDGNDDFSTDEDTTTAGDGYSDEDDNDDGQAFSGFDESEEDLSLDFEDGKEAENRQAPIESEENLVVLPRSKAIVIRKLLQNIKENSEQVMNLLSGIIRDEDEERINIGQIGELEFIKEKDLSSSNEKIIEGVFDGERMIGPDGKQYNVPSNYASKSKLVEGDMLKLTITANGTFLYKQIGPIDRIRVVGTIEKDDDGNYHVVNKNKRWSVLTASVTYFRGSPGDEAVILIPKTGESKWAAVENVVVK